MKTELIMEKDTKMNPLIHEMMIKERLNDLQREAEIIGMIQKMKSEEVRRSDGFLVSVAEFLIWSGSMLKKRFGSSSDLDMALSDGCKK